MRYINHFKFTDNVEKFDGNMSKCISALQDSVSSNVLWYPAHALNISQEAQDLLSIKKEFGFSIYAQYLKRSTRIIIKKDGKKLFHVKVKGTTDKAYETAFYQASRLVSDWKIAKIYEELQSKIRNKGKLSQIRKI